MLDPQPPRSAIRTPAGRARFERRGPLWLPAGLTLAAVLNGVVSSALHQAPLVGTFGYVAWYGLVVATLVAAATFYALFVLIRRLNAAALATASAR